MRFVKTSDGNIGAFVNGQTYCITPESIHYDSIYEALQNNDAASFNELQAGEDVLTAFCEGHIDFRFGSPRWEGVPMPDLFADRIVELVKGGHEFEPMLNFMYNLSENPSDHSIVELIDFLGNKNLPITKDGCFLGYKAVRPDYKDLYSGTIDNSIGCSPSVERSEVNDNRDKHCAAGLHVGGLDYVQSYGPGSHGREYKIVIVKVNPKNVVTVPTDANFQKLRACEYEVVANFSGALDEACYDDAVHFKNSTPEPVVAERPTGWVAGLRERFARIGQLMRQSREDYVEA